MSLASELAALARAVQGVADLLGGDEPGDVPEGRQRAAAALLNLLGARLVLLRRVVVGAEGLQTILAALNEADTPLPGDNPDVLLGVQEGQLRRRRER